MPDVRAKVVIVGAGFGGIEAAKSLRSAPVEVTVIDRQNHHCFQPLLYQVATAALSPADVAFLWLPEMVRVRGTGPDPLYQQRPADFHRRPTRRTRGVACSAPRGQPSPMPRQRRRQRRANCHHAAPDRGDRVRGGGGRRLGILDRARRPPVSGVLGGRDGQRPNPRLDRQGNRGAQVQGRDGGRPGGALAQWSNYR
jgi:hypothetical protein